MSRTRKLTAAFATSRLIFGAGLVVLPDRLGSPWLGNDAGRAPVKIAIRALGARDVALSAGTLSALRSGDRVGMWLSGAIVSDLCDVVSTLATPGRSLPANARWGTAVLGGGSALAGAVLLASESR
jgi:hypothetical protein